LSKDQPVDPYVHDVPHPPGRSLSDGVGAEKLKLAHSDGYETCLYALTPPGGATHRPVVQYHGIQSHPGWFVGSANYLACQGFPVFQVTRRGSGSNTQRRGDAPSARRLLRDVTEACRFAARMTGDETGHLLGISWGGKLLTAYAACADEGFCRSLTLVAPGIAPRIDASPAVKLRVAMALLTLRAGATFEIPLSDESLFTDRSVMHQYLREDPFRLHRATARFLWASRCLDTMLARRRRPCIDVPATVLLADRDRIVDNDRTKAVLGRLAADLAVAVELPGAHTLEFEDDPMPFYRTLAAAILRGEQ
jgi:alpha-beta hydrolase superfamily lysophospholipase